MRTVAQVASAPARTGLAAVAVAIVLAFGLGLAAPPARAAGPSAATTPSPLGGITAPQSTTTAATPTAVSTTASGAGGGGISSGAAAVIAVAAFLVIVGIAVAIFRDARRRTRGRHAPSVDADRVPGSKRPPKARKLSPAERRRRKRGRAPRRR